MAKKLTHKQQLFVEAYAGQAQGNATESARLAGYAGDDNALSVRGCRLLQNPKVLEKLAIIAREDPLVLSRVERRRFLSCIIQDESHSISDRLRALDLLAKASGDYIQRVELSGKDGGAIKTQSLPVEKLSDQTLAELERELVLIHG